MSCAHPKCVLFYWIIWSPRVTRTHTHTHTTMVDGKTDLTWQLTDSPRLTNSVTRDVEISMATWQQYHALFPAMRRRHAAAAAASGSDVRQEMSSGDWRSRTITWRSKLCTGASEMETNSPLRIPRTSRSMFPKIALNDIFVAFILAVI